ncbi:MAG: hypothetical protein LBK82_03160, partial [Planctomycetaceae bacterium]|nr:hypothetical protein [Planctomycetaceae bacterium]
MATQFAIVNLIHGRRVRRRDLSAKGRPPTKGRLPDDCLFSTNIPLKYSNDLPIFGEDFEPGLRHFARGANTGRTGSGTD